MRKTLIKCLLTSILIVSLIVACCIPSFAYSYPPVSLVNYSLQGYSSRPFMYDSYSSLFSQVCRVFTVSSSDGHPYYFELYISKGVECDIGIYSSNGSQYPVIDIFNNNTVSVDVYGRWFMFDGVSGQLLNQSYFYIWDNSLNRYRLLDSPYVLAPDSTVGFGIQTSTSFPVTFFSFSNYFNMDVFSGSWFLSSYGNRLPHHSFEYTINDHSPDTVLNFGSTSGSVSGSLDSSTGDLNVQVDLEQDYTPVTDSISDFQSSLVNPSESFPDEFESEELDDYTDAVDQSDQALDSFKGNHSFSQLWNNFSLSSFQSSLMFWSDRFEDISDTNPVFPVVIASMLSFGLIAVILNRRVGN